MEIVTEQIDSLWLAKRIGDSSDYTSRGIAAKVSELVYVGQMAIGSKLPSTRDLAKVLGVSQATVSGAQSCCRRATCHAGG